MPPTSARRSFQRMTDPARYLATVLFIWAWEIEGVPETARDRDYIGSLLRTIRDGLDVPDIVFLDKATRDRLVKERTLTRRRLSEARAARAIFYSPSLDRFYRAPV